jgi:hypothetical protein
MDYFGERWDAPAFDGGQQVPTPAGEACLFCQRVLEDTDSGTFINAPLNLTPVHIQCWLRSGLGSIAHLKHECSCYGKPCYGKEEPGDDRDYYDQGQEVMEFVRSTWRPDAGA